MKQRNTFNTIFNSNPNLKKHNTLWNKFTLYNKKQLYSKITITYRHIIGVAKGWIVTNGTLEEKFRTPIECVSIV